MPSDQQGTEAAELEFTETAHIAGKHAKAAVALRSPTGSNASSNPCEKEEIYLLERTKEEKLDEVNTSTWPCVCAA
jgi:hypothetical protein